MARGVRYREPPTPVLRTRPSLTLRRRHRSLRDDLRIRAEQGETDRLAPRPCETLPLFDDTHVAGGDYRLAGAGQEPHFR